MYIEAVIIGILIGVFRNGNLANISDISLRGLPLMILSVIFQVSPVFLIKIPAVSQYIYLFPFISLCMMTLAVMVNYKRPGMKIIVAGAILNIIAMGMNGFYMPIDYTALGWAGLDPLLESIKNGAVIGYSSIENATGISKILGKIIPIPKIYPFAKVLSIGDIIITLGIIFFFYGEMTRSFFRRDSRVVQFSYNTKFK